MFFNVFLVSQRPSRGPQEAPRGLLFVFFVECIKRFGHFTPRSFSMFFTMVFGHLRDNRVLNFTKTQKMLDTFAHFVIFSCSVLAVALAAIISCFFLGPSPVQWLFKNEQNARDIRPKSSPWPRLVPKTHNLTKILCFYSKIVPPGSKTLVFCYFFRGLQDGPKRAPRGLIALNSIQ